jgi:hypothetical protein
MAVRCLSPFFNGLLGAALPETRTSPANSTRFTQTANSACSKGSPEVIARHGHPSDGSGRARMIRHAGRIFKSVPGDWTD